MFEGANGRLEVSEANEGRQVAERLIKNRRQSPCALAQGQILQSQESRACTQWLLNFVKKNADLRALDEMKPGDAGRKKNFLI